MQKVAVRTEGRKTGEIWKKYKCGKTSSIAEERRSRLQKERGKAVSWRWDKCRQNLQDSGQWCIWADLGGWAETETVIFSASLLCWNVHLPFITYSAEAEEQRWVLFSNHFLCRDNNLCRSARQLPGCEAFLAKSAEPIYLQVPGCNSDVKLYKGLLEDDAGAMSTSKSQEGGNFYKGWKNKVKENKSSASVILSPSCL